MHTHLLCKRDWVLPAVLLELCSEALGHLGREAPLGLPGALALHTDRALVCQHSQLIPGSEQLARLEHREHVAGARLQEDGAPEGGLSRGPRGGGGAAGFQGEHSEGEAIEGPLQQAHKHTGRDRLLDLEGAVRASAVQGHCERLPPALRARGGAEHREAIQEQLSRHPDQLLALLAALVVLQGAPQGEHRGIGFGAQVHHRVGSVVLQSQRPGLLCCT